MYEYQFLIFATNLTARTLFYRALMTGMRKDEQLSLNWFDHDWEMGSRSSRGSTNEGVRRHFSHTAQD